MNNEHLHIVSFDVPFPPNYGGVIDVFYKLKALHKLGVKIHLHTFDYGRGKQEELNIYCEKVYYYKRKKSLHHFASKKPYIVSTRNNSKLTLNLKKDNFPILFEGLHTTYPLLHNNFKDRTVMVRMHNIEHFYYKGLAKSEKNSIKALFFLTESNKLKHYESILNKVDYILSISPFEQDYFTQKFGEKTKYVPVFHKQDNVESLSEKGEFALYHGDLRVSDNIKAVNYLLDVFNDIDYKLVIASSYSNKKINDRIIHFNNVSFKLLSTKNKTKLQDLFSKAHINALPTFQKTGIKLKLIHALFRSRFCVVNTEMVEDTGIESLCEVAQNKIEFKSKIEWCINEKYTKEIIKNRKQHLSQFDTLTNAQKIVGLLK
jgi:hypothetical protein